MVLFYVSEPGAPFADPSADRPALAATVRRWFGLDGRPGREGEGTQRVQDDGYVDRFLEQGALHGGEVTQRRRDHADERQADAGIDALQGDASRSLRDLDARQETVEPVDEQDGIRRLGRGGGAACPHRHAHVGGGKGRSVVDAVAHHHHRAVLALREHHHDLLVGRQLGPDRVEVEPGGHRLGDVPPVARRQHHAFEARTPKPGEKRRRPFTQFVGQKDLAVRARHPRTRRQKPTPPALPARPRRPS